MTAAVLPLVLLAQAAPTAADVKDGSRATIDEFVGLVRRGDERALRRDVGYAFVSSRDPRDPAKGYDVVPPQQFLRSIAGCEVSHISYRYSEVGWVCKGRPGKSPAHDPKYGKCFDAARSARVRQVNTSVIVQVQDTAEWSNERCGRQPVFAPPAPPPLPKAKN